MGRNLESLFARYVERGDLRALTKVFDRTARDLLALAQHEASVRGGAFEGRDLAGRNAA